MFYELTLNNKGKTTRFWLTSKEMKSYIADELIVTYSEETKLPMEIAEKQFKKNFQSNFNTYSPQGNNGCELSIDKHCSQMKLISQEAMDTDPDIARLCFAEYALCNYLKPTPVLEKISDRIGKNTEIGTRYLLTEEIINEVVTLNIQIL